MGTLYIISTPIGNLGDITQRAIESLKNVDYILCEDTRVSGKLLKHLEISKKMVSFNEYSEDAKSPFIVNDLLGANNIALISDAGTPLISDPGYKLVRECIQKGIKIEAIPGPSSVITALTLSGLPPDKFTFVGYLPKKDAKRKKVLDDLKKTQQIIKSTIISFESPYRLLKTLKNIKEVFGDIEIVICRELTKIHEEVRREKISKQIENYSKNKPKGEFILLI